MTFCAALFPQPTRLNVFKNDQDTWDYTNPNLGGPGKTCRGRQSAADLQSVSSLCLLISDDSGSPPGRVRSGWTLTGSWDVQEHAGSRKRTPCSYTIRLEGLFCWLAFFMLLVCYCSSLATRWHLQLIDSKGPAGYLILSASCNSAGFTSRNSPVCSENQWTHNTVSGSESPLIFFVLKLKEIEMFLHESVYPAWFPKLDSAFLVNIPHVFQVYMIKNLILKWELIEIINVLRFGFFYFCIM